MRHLDLDHLVQRQLTPDLPFEGVEHLEVAELLDRHVEGVPFGDGPVPVEHESHQARGSDVDWECDWGGSAPRSVFDEGGVKAGLP